ncbi:hypothetical protein TSAR_004477 [Trichomalopsis sarcophagae]|uniref:Uncharacterized protein n=1 Tax=Trichomalopsis sarcophagae TaxID=543379 RepID=A0A232EKG4_9HYME|nr:hypothetical protein TSAR_004477 [Trichomalopsis sarcophagae]
MRFTIQADKKLSGLNGSKREGDQTLNGESGPTLPSKIGTNARQNDGHLAEVRGSWWRQSLKSEAPGGDKVCHGETAIVSCELS